ncbi:MAG: TonB-dependent receptor [Ignavibacteriota bacterium]
MNASKAGFNTTVRSGVELLVGQVVRVDLQLPLGNVDTLVEVTDTVPTVETGRTTAYTNIYDERDARNISLSSRNPLEFFQFNPVLNSPRVSNGGSGTATPGITYGGYGSVIFNVDGVSNNLAQSARNVVISAEAISEYQTLIDPPAEYGRGAGPTLNAISRSGTNEWHGSLYLATKQKELGAMPYLLAPGTPRPEFERYNYGATISGPVVKNRIFFFLNYERWSQNLPVVSTFGGAQQAQIASAIGIPSTSVGTWTTTFRANTVTAKGDIILNSKNRLSLRYNDYYDIESQEDSGTITREVSNSYKDTPQSGTAQLVTTFSPTVLNELRFLYGFRPYLETLPHPDAPGINLSGIGTFNSNPNGDYWYRESGYQVADNVSWMRGRHSFKAGVEILPANYQDRTTNWSGTFAFSGLSANGTRAAVTPLQQYLNTTQGLMDPATGLAYTYSQFSRSTGTLVYDATQVNTGYFIQDDMRLGSRLKLNLGVRYEFFGRPGGNLNAAYPQTGKIPQDYSDIEPRLGLAWDPFGDSKTVVRASYGIYANPIGPASYDSWERQNGLTVKSVTVLPTQAGAPAFTLGPVPPFNAGTAAIPNIYEVSSNYKDGRVQDWSFGVERQLLGGFSIELSYLGNHANNLTYSVPTNLTQTGTLADGRTLFGGVANRPDPNIGIIYSVRSNDTYQNYNAALVMLKHRASHGISFQLGYQYQHISGCLDRTVATVNGSCFDQGVASTNQPNRFTATAVWEPHVALQNHVANAVINGWLLSNSSQIQNGYPYSAFTGQDTNGDGTISDRLIGSGLNIFRMPLYVQVDFRLSRKFQIRELGHLEIYGEAVNSSNNENVYAVNTTWGLGAKPNAAFGTATSAEIPRQFQLGLRYSF